MDITPEILSRAQFGFTIGFHILFPTLNIGLATFIVLMEGAWLRTGKQKYLQICQFWTKIFALTFGMGVVSGIVLSYELGTNFGKFTEAIGGILGPLFGYEVLSAFFLEAGFLGIMVFGWRRVPPSLHFLSTVLVTVGTIISAFWIMSANSWMQTPAGFAISNQVYLPSNWWDAIFNPSFLPRFAHMILASYITAAFTVAGISAWYLLKNREEAISKTSLTFCLWAGLILLPIQITFGDVIGLVIHKYQPLKTAAIEANFHTQPGAPLILIGFPDVDTQQTRFAISIPKGASWINLHKGDGILEGLDIVPKKDWPQVMTVFWSFRIMVGCGVFMLCLALIGVMLNHRKKGIPKSFLVLAVLTIPLGYIATIFGWLTAEVGRQPWIIYNLMRTVDGATVVSLAQVALSFAVFLFVYGIIFSFYLYYLLKLIKKGPQPISKEDALLTYLPLVEPEK